MDVGETGKILLVLFVEKHLHFFLLIIWIFKKYLYLCTRNTELAQLVEHWSPKPGVGSSSLSFRAFFFYQLYLPFLFS